MFTLIILAVYTVVVLLLVPLERIAKWQTKVRKTWKKVKDNIEE